MDTALPAGNVVNTSDTDERTVNGKILGWIAAASEVGWKNKVNRNLWKQDILARKNNWRESIQNSGNYICQKQHSTHHTV
jgi:hypothetical protein